MKRFLLIVLLTMIGCVIVGNTIKHQNYPITTIEIENTAREAEVVYEVKDQVDDYGTYLGTVILIHNNLYRAIYIKVVFTENGEKESIVKYVPARETKRAWYGNRTLKVIHEETYWDYSPIDID